ncbi:MAG: ATP-binding protein [Ferruginibacter sp.]
MLKKIVIIGPESTGKSTLCKQLAEHYATTWVPEYARGYLETNGTNYKYEDLYKIAQGQIVGEDKADVRCQRPDVNMVLSRVNNQLLFIDTDLYVIKVWSEFVFNKCDNRILTGIANRKYDLYLLCNIDLPWVKDTLREYPDLRTRKKLFHYYKEAMINQTLPWSIISGSYEERLMHAITAVDKIL